MTAPAPRLEETTARRRLRALLTARRDSGCRCEITVDSAHSELVAMRGCKDPRYVCPVLDKARRITGAER